MNYCQREWLNDDESASTGSVVAFDGMVKHRYDDRKKVRHFFLEIADCHNKVRLHSSNIQTSRDFIKKLKLLRQVVDDFIVHMESTI
jgi:molybdopterin synthase catalytic subunit